MRISHNKYPLQSWPARTKITTFNIVHDEIFESEVVLKKPAFVIGQDSYTPSAMDMCTPFRPQQCVISQIPIKNHTNSKFFSTIPWTPNFGSDRNCFK